jgi:mannose-6-phosphate isomerase-like protein (cupin superfamily)
MIKCKGCGKAVNYNQEPEIAMGAIKCPLCGVVIDQTGKVHQKKTLSSLIRVIAAKASLKGFISDIEKDTVENKNFRKVLYTGKNSQLVLMSLKPGEEIGEEIHPDTDQFFRVDSGSGEVVINGMETPIKDGFAIVIPQGAKHNVINTGKDDLKLYSIYSPPHHERNTIHKTKEEADSSKEHFDGKTTE